MAGFGVDAALSRSQVYNYEKLSAPFRSGNTWFFFKNNGLQNQSVLYKMADEKSMASAEVLIDLNAEFPDGTTAMRWYGRCLGTSVCASCL